MNEVHWLLLSTVRVIFGTDDEFVDGSVEIADVGLHGLLIGEQIDTH